MEEKSEKKSLEISEGSGQSPVEILAEIHWENEFDGGILQEIYKSYPWWNFENFVFRSNRVDFKNFRKKNLEEIFWEYPGGIIGETPRWLIAGIFRWLLGGIPGIALRELLKKFSENIWEEFLEELLPTLL